MDPEAIRPLLVTEDVVLEAGQVTIPPGALEFLGAEEVKLDGKPTGEVSYSFLLRG